jgi:hypothetical protein
MLVCIRSGHSPCRWPPSKRPLPTFAALTTRRREAVASATPSVCPLACRTSSSQRLSPITPQSGWAHSSLQPANFRSPTSKTTTCWWATRSICRARCSRPTSSRIPSSGPTPCTAWLLSITVVSATWMATVPMLRLH